MGRLGAPWGRLGDGMEPSWVSWTRLGGILERLRGVLETSWELLGASWGRLGGVLEASWTSWRRLGSVLEASWKRLGGVLEASWRQRPEKANLKPQNLTFTRVS